MVSHFLPNLFVTGIILDYLHLVSENPSPHPGLEKKLLGGDPPPSETILLPKFSAIYSMKLIIINPLHSRVAYRSFDYWFSPFFFFRFPSPSKSLFPCSFLPPPIYLAPLIV